MAEIFRFTPTAEAERAEHVDWLTTVLRHHTALTPEDHHALGLISVRLEGKVPLSLDEAAYLWRLFCETEIDVGF